MPEIRATSAKEAATAPTSWRRRIENAVIIVVLALMAVLPLTEIVGRRLAGIGIPGSQPLVQHLTMLTAFLGAALAARADRLLALSTATFLPDRWRDRVRVFTAEVAVAVVATLVSASWDLVEIKRQSAEAVALSIPVWFVVLVMPLGFALVGWRIVAHASSRWRLRLIAAAGLLIPVLLSWNPQWQGVGLVLPGSLLLVLATMLGLPIFATIGGFALLYFWNDGVPVAAVTVESYRLTDSALMPAIPLFTLGGYILAEGGASERLVRVFRALVGWMPGGLAVVTTVVFAFFTSFTGASGVTILSLGGLLLPVLMKSNYSERFSVGLLTASGSIGLLFPPSLPVILYAVYSSTPIVELFLGGFVPGMLLVLLVAAWGVRQGLFSKVGREPFRWKEAASALWEAKWELLLPAVVLVGIFGGYTTLVEAASVTVLYAFIVECFVYKDLSIRRELPDVMVQSATLIGSVLIILGVALGFTNFLIDADIPFLALEWVESHIESKLVFLLALNVFLLIVGCLMDIYSAILVVVPLIAPMGVAYGVDPVHLGIIFLANLELGYLTPPVGMNLFLSSLRFEQPLTSVYRATLPFLLIMGVGVLLITYVPELTLTLVRLAGR